MPEAGEAVVHHEQVAVPASGAHVKEFTGCVHKDLPRSIYLDAKVLNVVTRWILNSWQSIPMGRTELGNQRQMMFKLFDLLLAREPKARGWTGFVRAKVELLEIRQSTLRQHNMGWRRRRLVGSEVSRFRQQRNTPAPRTKPNANREQRRNSSNGNPSQDSHRITSPGQSICTQPTSTRTLQE